jgi:hypothetical protein
MEGKLEIGATHVNNLVTKRDQPELLRIGFVYDYAIFRLRGAMLDEWLRLKQIGETIDAAVFHKLNATQVDAWKGYNLITNEGFLEILDSIFAANGGTHYFGLTDATPTVAAADTNASHAGWVEIGVAGAADEYDETTRPVMAMSAAAAGEKSTSAVSVFTINETKTVGGSFITDQNTKGGSTGTLLSVAAFAGGDRDLVNNDVLNMSATLAAS